MNRLTHMSLRIQTFLAFNSWDFGIEGNQFAELLDGVKKDVLANVQESVDQISVDVEYVESETEGVQA